MTRSLRGRRAFLKATAAGVAAPLLTTFGRAAPPKSANDRLGIGAVGMRYRGSVVTAKAVAYGPLVAVCDVDRHVREQARASFGNTAAQFEDYRKLLDQKDVDVVIIASPDHWHAAMAVDAMRAGKDVFVEKPLTLTIDEGKLIRKVAEETGRVVQVGTVQRSDPDFRLACELVRAGRLGRVTKVDVVVGGNPRGGPFAPAPAPSHLNWDLWLGPAPKVDYTPERCHYTFRWWYDYAGGKLCDWGAHHLDIVQWSLGEQHSGPVAVEATATLPAVPNGYDTPTDFHVRLRYASGVEVDVRAKGESGIRFHGDKASLAVNRGKLSGTALDALRDDPLPADRYMLYPTVPRKEAAAAPGRASDATHVGNFFDCVHRRDRATVSDPASQHRSATVCHLANLACRLGRPLTWDPAAERFVGDAEADRHLTRERRKGYELS